ncbi:PAS domain-containing hybrid sensor histidine kinase/response regulator [Desulfonema ishimotonii]|nr:PAS domain S-box protein [Desulfonema ishimotonii]
MKFRKTEQALREKEELFRKSFEMAPVGIAMVDLDYRLKKANRAYCDTLGYSEEELRHLTLSDFTHPDDLEKNLRLQGALGRGEIRHFEMEKRFIQKSGKVVYGILRASLIRSQAGKPLYFIGQVLDITERKQMEEALKVAEREKAAVLNSISEIVVYLDTEYRILWANRATSQFLGISPEQLAGRHCFDVWFHRNSPCHDCPVTRAISTCQVEEGQIVGPDGQAWLIRGYPVNDEQGAFVGIVEIVQDITEKQQLENELLKMKKLESVGIFAGGIAHDFNNLISIILGNIEMAAIQDHAGPPEFLSEARKATLRAKALTRQLMTFSKGGAPVRKRGDILRLIEDTAAEQLKNSGLTFQIITSSRPETLLFDPEQIRFVLENLIINAREAMPNGGHLQFTVENVRVGDKGPESGMPLCEGRYVRISITDSGVGIPETLLPLIFDPYFSTKEMGVQKGMGLGLATSYSIVRKHGGHISAASQEHMGSTFSVYLPAGEGETTILSRPAEQADHKIAGNSVADTGRKKRILVMDDEEMVRNIAGRMLAHLGYGYAVAEDGHDAVEIYEKALNNSRPFDAVILDLTAADGPGGQETLQRLRQADPQVKAIVSSGYAEDPVMLRFREFGFADVIPKPYSIRIMADALARIFRQPAGE